MSLGQVWSRFLDYLAGLGASPALIVVVAAALGFTLIGAAYALWLAFSLHDAPADRTSDDA
jgi:hypothetical protein